MNDNKNKDEKEGWKTGMMEVKIPSRLPNFHSSKCKTRTL